MFVTKSCILIYYIILFTVKALFFSSFNKNDALRRKYHQKQLFNISHKILKLFNIKLLSDFENQQQGVLIISNHLSWLDIFIIASRSECIFISSKEIQETFFLGFMSAIAGTVYVDRRNFHHLNEEINKVSYCMLNGINVCLFPEATSSNGEKVLAFHNTFIQSAINIKTEILCLVINFLEIDGEKISSNNKDKVFWYGKMRFLPSLFKVLKAKEIVVSLEQVGFSRESQDRKILSKNLYQAVTDRYLPV